MDLDKLNPKQVKVTIDDEIKDMINETQIRNLILETIRQLDKFNVTMEDNDDWYFDNDMVLSSFENEAKLQTLLIKS